MYSPQETQRTLGTPSRKYPRFNVELIEIANHDHWDYDKASKFNHTAWEFLKKYELDSDPQYQKYKWN